MEYKQEIELETRANSDVKTLSEHVNEILHQSEDRSYSVHELE